MAARRRAKKKADKDAYFLDASVLMYAAGWSRHRATSWIGILMCAGFLTWAFVDISRYTFSGSPCVMRHFAWALAGVGLLHLSPAWWPRKM